MTVTKDVYRDFIIEKLLPAIYKKFPIIAVDNSTCSSTRTIPIPTSKKLTRNGKKPLETTLDSKYQ